MPSKPRPWPRVQEALRPLNEQERAALVESVERYGVQEHIKVLPDGRIIDGHHRFEIAGDACAIDVLDMGEDQAFRLAVELNTARRQMSAGELRQAIAWTIADEPGRPNTEIAREYGVSEFTVRHIRGRGRSINIEHPQRPRPCSRITAEEKREMRLLAGQGLSHAEIARRLGRDRSAISRVLQREPVAPLEDELAERRERHRRERGALKLLFTLVNVDALRVWDQRAVVFAAIEGERDPNALIALLGAVRRTQRQLDEFAAQLDLHATDDDRERVAALLRASGFDG